MGKNPTIRELLETWTARHGGDAEVIAVVDEMAEWIIQFSFQARVHRAIADELRQQGYDGLYCPDAGCGCAIAALAPCDCPSMDDCIAGYKCTLAGDARCPDCGIPSDIDLWICEHDPKERSA